MVMLTITHDHSLKWNLTYAISGWEELDPQGTYGCRGLMDGRMRLA